MTDWRRTSARRIPAARIQLIMARRLFNGVAGGNVNAYSNAIRRRRLPASVALWLLA